MPNGSASSPTSRLRTSEYGRGPTPLATYSRRSSTCSRAAVPVGSSPETSRPGRQSTGGSGGGTQTEPSSGSTPPYASPASASSPGAIRPTAARATRNTRGSSALGRRPGRSLGRGVADQGVDGLLVAGHGIVHATILSARGVRAGAWPGPSCWARCSGPCGSVSYAANRRARSAGISGRGPSRPSSPTKQPAGEEAEPRDQVPCPPSNIAPRLLRPAPSGSLRDRGPAGAYSRSRSGLSPTRRASLLRGVA